MGRLRKEEGGEGMNVRKNGVPLADTKYKLGCLRLMTKQELIEEILGTHSWDYLLECGMVVEDE